jgi:hypothetical protein
VDETDTRTTRERHSVPVVSTLARARALARALRRAVHFCWNGGDDRYFQPATDAFNRALRRYIAQFEAGRGSLLAGHFSEHLLHLSRQRLLRILHPFVFDPFNLRYRDFLYARIAGALMESGRPVPQLPATYKDADCFAEIVDRPDACVVLSLHTGFPHTVRLLSSSGRSAITSVAGSPEWAEMLYRSNDVPRFEHVRLVRADRQTLVNLISSAENRHAICCHPDHISPETGTCDLISRAMFEFAARRKLQIYFLDYAVSRQGKLEVFSERAERSADVDDAIRQFCAFCRCSSGRTVRPIGKRR